jgi:hypothetical protein
VTALSEADLDRLVKLCGMLGSSFPGERAVAAAKASEFLRERELTWEQVLRPRWAEQPPLPAPGSGWRRIARECLKADAELDLLSDWEFKFLGTIARSRHPISPKQAIILDRIAALVGVT